MPSSPVEFRSGELRIQGELHQPDACEASSVVVVCHPHPQRGGDMHNNVVGIVVRALTDQGIAALSFNFRGVGGSEGSFDNGVGEGEDARAALAYAASLPGISKVGLAGYSFGAGIAAAMVDDSVAGLCLVALPGRGPADDAGIRRFGGPVLLVSGDQDSVSSLEAIRDLAPTLLGTVEVVAVAGADHFWWGHEGELHAAVGNFFATLLT